jgi:hypothetical protein
MWRLSRDLKLKFSPAERWTASLSANLLRRLAFPVVKLWQRLDACETFD